MRRRLQFPIGYADTDKPTPQPEPFDHADWIFELKFDGFRAAADTVRGRLISRNSDRMRRFEAVFELLPKGCVDGELVVLDDAGRPQFNELLFGRGRPTYVAFDLLMADGVDLRPLPLRERKARLARIGKGADRWIALTGIVGDGARFTEPWSRLTSRALSPSVWPTLVIRSTRGGTRFSIAVTRSVAGVPSGFASGGGFANDEGN